MLNEEQWPEFAREQGVDPADSNSLNDKQVVNAVQRRITTAPFPGLRQGSSGPPEQPWTVDNC